MALNVIHRIDALKVLESGQPCDIEVFKMSTGDILFYKNVTLCSGHFRGGTHKVKLPQSGVIREFRDVMLKSINLKKIYF